MLYCRETPPKESTALLEVKCRRMRNRTVVICAVMAAVPWIFIEGYVYGIEASGELMLSYYSEYAAIDAIASKDYRTVCYWAFWTLVTLGISKTFA